MIKRFTVCARALSILTLSLVGPCAYSRDLDGRFSLDLTLPPNTTGRLVLPTRPEQRLFVDGQPFAGAVAHQDGRLQAAIGSGAYRFEVR